MDGTRSSDPANTPLGNAPLTKRKSRGPSHLMHYNENYHHEGKENVSIRLGNCLAARALRNNASASRVPHLESRDD